MASIFKTPNGKYRIQFSHKKERYSAVFDTKRECNAWLIEKTNELSKPVAETKTFKQMLETYMEKVSAKKEGERKEVERINRFIRTEPELCNKLIGEVAASDIADWRDRRLKDINPQTGSPIRNSTVIRDMTWLSNAFRVAKYEWGWIHDNPMENMKRPEPVPPRDRLIKPHEIDTMLFVLGYDKDKPLVSVSERIAGAFIMALETGLRAQELCTLEWGDIEGRVLSVGKSKTQAGYRKVPLSSRVMELLDQLSVNKTNESVFNLVTSQLDSNFRKARKMAGFDVDSEGNKNKDNFTFHDARANATTALAKKLDILDLAKVIGHKNLKTLMVYYRDTAETLVDKLD